MQRDKFEKAWQGATAYLKDGVSLIPVREKDEGEFVAKSPYHKWKEFQTRIATESELWQVLDYRGTNSVAIVCGAISGNLEVIDVDVKYRAGIDAILFQDIKTFYPELFSKLRIHKTPSGGYHILYRVTGGVVPGNVKLAGRYATEEELASKPKNKTYNFLETRGEGGFVLSDLCAGYSAVAGGEIPVITWEERNSLIVLCQTYNEIIKVAPIYKPTKSESEYYSESPWDHFNGACDPVAFMADFGWNITKQNGHFIWFTRPGKDKGISASWNIEKRIFYIFTSSTELESERGYHPVSILAALKYGGDKKAVYAYLVSKGYGRVKPAIEQSVIKKRALSGEQIPANFSPEAQTDFIEYRALLAQNHPYGTFIKYDEEAEKLSVSYESLIYVAGNLGLRTFGDDVILINGHTIERVSFRQLQDILKAYIHEEDPDEYEKLCNVFEKFLKENTKFISQRLPLLDENLIIKDTREECYKFFANGYLLITKSFIEFNSYELFEKYVWAERVQPRDYIEGEGGRFVEYLNLALVKPEEAKVVMGFLSHEFKDETTGYIVILTEACKDPKNGGGSGKNVFCNLLKLTTTYMSKPGGQGKFDEKYFQAWTNQKVFGVSDLPQNFDFKAFKEPATGSFIQKRLYKDEFEVPVELTPKFIMQTNYSYTDSDGGLIRRIIPVEFTDFFTRCGGLDMHFGVHFPKGWTVEDYAGFDNYVAQAVQLWMLAGCKLKAPELTEDGWLKKFRMNFGDIAAGFIVERFNDVIKDERITNDALKELVQKYYSDNDIPTRYHVQFTKIGEALKYYCENFGLEVKTGQTIRVSPVSTKDGRKFKPITDIGRALLEDAKASYSNENDIPF